MRKRPYADRTSVQPAKKKPAEAESIKAVESDKKDDEIGDSDKDSTTNGVEAKEGYEPKEIDEAIPDMNNESMEVD